MTVRRSRRGSCMTLRWSRPGRYMTVRWLGPGRSLTVKHSRLKQHDREAFTTNTQTTRCPTQTPNVATAAASNTGADDEAPTTSPTDDR